MMRVSCVFLLCLLLVAPSFQYGILRVEEIWSNDNIPEVKIEDMIVTESQIYIDYIEDLSGEGVTVEDIIFSDGSITIPGNFVTTAGVEFESALFANGGVFCDAGEQSGFSFTIAENSGDVFVLGTLQATGGFLASDKFFFDGITGETTLNIGLLRPNGGVIVNGGVSTFSPSGSIGTINDVQVTQDLYFGDFSTFSERTISRIASTESNGGTTFLQGQSAASNGGNLYLSPGDGAARGNIFLGTERTSELYLGRSGSSNSDNGGSTAFAGQNSLSGDGGDIFFDAGNSGAIGFGGAIVLAPGLSTLDGRAGRVLLGSPDLEDVNHDAIAGRPPISSGFAGHTVYAGQSTDNGVGGNFYLRAGSVESGSGKPGDLILTTGVDSAAQSTVVFGKDTATQLNIRRVSTVTSGGFTALYGQNATAGTGGDLFVRAGRSSTAAGGDLYLIPGSSVTGEHGNILIGLDTDALTVNRPDSADVAGSTTYAGQSGIDGTGGDLFVVGGEGLSQGGDIVLRGGVGAASLGGDVFLVGGTGTSLGGEVNIRGGDGAQRNGGDVAFSAVNGPLTLSTRGLFADGDIIVGPNVNSFIVDETPVRIEDGDLIIRSGSDYVTISNDDDAVISWNGVVVMQESQVIPVPLSQTPPDILTIRDDISDLSIDFNEVLQALNQCGHGLVHSVSQPNNVLEVCPQP